MPFQWGAPDIILLLFVVAIPATIVWALYRMVRRAVRAEMRDAMREHDRDLP
ncbi:MAG TPA: hypothetical protein VN615_02685 [Gaiellales bacterium]|nr:hypothetical protein [Gaiellales bacterium]